MRAARRAPWHAAGPSLIAATILLAGCTLLTADAPTPTPPEPTPTPGPTRTPVPSPTPSPTPRPTPTYTNLPDPELAEIIPDAIGGVPLETPVVALTPGDVGTVYGPIGERFRSLIIGFTEEPRLTVFAMRADPPAVTTRGLRAYLPEIGQYLGIAEADPAPWELTTIGDKQVWTRGEDEATLPGTRIYTWALDDLVFLVIGTNEPHNLAALAALPG